ncbi:hypothetical protein IWW55_004677, partial [Coemansia sp. RSA 2706]
MNTPVSPANVVSAPSNMRSDSQLPESNSPTQQASQSSPCSSSSEAKRVPELPPELDSSYTMPDIQALPPGYPPKTLMQPKPPANGESDYDSAIRATYYGRRAYPEYDPANIGACPLRFIRQFEHAALHNGLHPRAWAKRLDSCLQGRAEDWAFDELPLEMPCSSWEVRRRQFLDWALLPAEQEIRRQRLLRFYHTESDLSLDFAYTFEEAARGLRDYKEDVWVRKCIANLQPPIRSALFELWPDGLPVRFRDLRDSLYAVDWSLYEAASASLKVVKCGAPYVYDSCSQGTRSAASRASTCSSAERLTRLTLTMPSTATGQQGSCSPPAPSPALLPTRRRRTAIGTAPPVIQNRNLVASPPATASHSPAGSTGAQPKSANEATRNTSSGLCDLITTLTRIPERERVLIMSALEKIVAGEEDAPAVDSAAGSLAVSPRPTKSQPRLATASSLVSRPTTAAALGAGSKSRVTAAAAMAATAQQFASMDAMTRPLLSPRAGANSSTDFEGRRSTTNRVSDSSRTSGTDDSDAAADALLRARARASADSADLSDAAGKIKLRTRPLTAVPYSRRLSSPLLDIHEGRADAEAPATGQLDVAAGAMLSQDKASSKDSLRAKQPGPTLAHKTGHARKLSSRKSDSALTTATRSMRTPGGHFGRDNDSDNALRSPEFTILHPELSQ